MKARNYEELVILIKELDKRLEEGSIGEETAFDLLNELQNDYNSIKEASQKKMVKKIFDI